MFFVNAKPHNKFILSLLGFAFAFVVSSVFAQAAFNEQINYQGKLTDNVGATVTDGIYDMEFRLYTQATGGSHIWLEYASTSVSNGLFSHMLGTSTSLSNIDFDQTLYLGVTVGADSEMTPRKVLGAVPAAFEAKQLDGLATSSFLRSDQADEATGLLTFSGGASTSDLVISGQATTSDLFVTGNVGIGSSSPSSLLTVEGNSYLGGNLTVSSTLQVSGLSGGGGGSVANVAVLAPDGTFLASSTLSDSFITNDLTLGTGATFANDIITPNALQSAGQSDEYCLTYEATGTTWAWQDCAGSLADDSLDWDKLTDTMTLDATTTIAMAHALNFDSGTLFVDGQDSRVGIGTTTPDYLLTVAGDALIDEFLRVGDHTDNTRIILAGQNGNATSSALEFSENNASGNGIAFVYDSSNNYLNIEDTSADTNRWRLYRDSGNLQLLSGNLLVDGTGNSRIMGNLGIGTTSPYQELSVNGDLALTGALYDNNADAGTNGYVLQSTASGLQWVATSTLGLASGTSSHEAVTLAGTPDYLTLSNQEITLNQLDLQDDLNTFTSANLANRLTDETGTGNVVFATNPLLSGFVSNASSTIGDGTGTGGLTVSGNSTTTGDAYFESGIGIGRSVESPYLIDAYAPASAFTRVTADGDTGAAFSILNNDSGNYTQMVMNGSNRGGSFITSLDDSGVIQTNGTGGLVFDSVDASAPIIFASGGFGLSNERMRITGSGDIGIGTTSPSALLTVGSSTQNAIPSNQLYNSVFIAGSLELDGAFYDSSNSAGTNGFILQSTGSGIDWVATSTLGLTGSSIADDSLDWAQFSDTMTLDATTTIAMAHALNFDSGTLFIDGQNNRIGIGTTTPAYLLDIYGDNGTGQTQIVLTNPDTSTNGFTGIVMQENVLAGQAGRFNYLNSGRNSNGINDPNQMAIYTLGGATGGIAMYTLADAPIVFATNGFARTDEHLRIDGGGQIGIGTTSPWARLSVVQHSGASGPLFAVASSSAGTATSTEFIIDEFGRVGIGTTSPYQGLSVAGDVAVTGAIYDNAASAGTNGMVLQTTGSGFAWVATSTLGLAGSGSVSFGSDNQIPFTNSGGTDFDYSSNFVFDGTSFGIGSSTPGGYSSELAIQDTDRARIILAATGASPDVVSFIDSRGDGNNRMQIGTVSDHGIMFFTGGTTFMHLDHTNDGLYVGGGGSAAGHLHVAADDAGDELVIGDNIYTSDDAAVRLNMGNSDESSFIRAGQSSSRYLSVGWVYNATAADAYGIIGTASGNNDLILQRDGGNVGIGTTSPASLLDVYGDFRVGTSGTPTLFVDASANRVGIGKTVPLAPLDIASVDNQAVIVTNTEDGGRSFDVVNLTGDLGGVMRLYNGGGVANVYLSGADTTSSYINSGNFGIGTTSPYQELSVDGDLALTGALYDNNADAGTTGFILQSTGSGIDWVATSTLGLTGSSIADDSLDWAQFSDTMTLDATTTIAMAHALNFDSGTLFIDGQNDRVGIGTTSPASALHVANGLTMLKGESTFNDLDYSGDFTHQLYIGNSSDDNTVTDNQGILLGTGGFGNNPMIRMRASGGSLGYLGWNNSETDFFINVVNNSRPFHIKTDGNERLTVLSGGNVGIGTTSPASLLDVYGDFRVGTSGTPTLFTDVSENQVGIGTTNPIEMLDIEAPAGTAAAGIRLGRDGFNNAFSSFTDVDSLYLVTGWTGSDSGAVQYGFSNAANIAGHTIHGYIGETSPTAGTAAMELIGGKRLSGTVQGVDDGDTLFEVTNLVQGLGTRLSLLGSGDLGLRDTSPDFGLEVVSSTTNGYFGISSLAGNDGDVFVIDANGNVGIGTTSPYQELSVDGDLALTGGLYDSTASAGTDGMVLQTNGASTQWVSTSSLNIAGTDTNSNVATYIVAATSSTNATDADYIADGTNDEATIQAAIDALPATGGIVYLLEGHYGIEGQIDIDREGVVLQGSGPGTVLRIATSTNSTFDVIDHLSGAGNSTIRDLTIDGNKANQSSGTMYGIRYSVDGATSTIHNVTIKNMRDDSIYVDSSFHDVTIDSVTISNNNDTGDYGIYVDGSNVTGLTISNSRFTHVDDGVNINSSTGERFKIVDNHFIEPSSNGVTINFGQYVLIANNTFDGNDVNSGSMIGVTGNASDVSIHDNVINGSNRDGIGISAERVTVSGNTIHNTGNGTLADAIDIGSSARYVVVSDNLISTTTAADGIAVDGDYVTVTGNLIENTDVNGIGVSGSENVIISNNIIKNTGTRGIYVSFTDDFTINDNMLIDIGANGIELDDGVSGTVSGNTIDEVGPGDAGIDIDEANDIVVSGNSISDAGGSVEGIEISNDSYRIHLDGNVITGTWTHLIDDNSSATTYLQNNRGSITADDSDFDGGAYTAFTITQTGTGNLLDLFDANGTATTSVLTVLDGGNVGVGTSTPYQEFSVAGDVAVTGALYDNAASAGTDGMVLQTTGSGFAWVATSTLGLGSAESSHDAVTLAGEDYLSLSVQQITANAINPDNLANTDFGDFSCNGTTCSLDANTVATGEISDNTIIEPDLNADNAAADGDFLQYDSTGTNFVWRSGAETLSDIGAEGDLVNEAGLYAALSDVSEFLEAGDTLDGETLALDSLSYTGTLDDAQVNDTLTIGASSVIADNLIHPDDLLSSGQSDEYCLTYETTGDTWEWQDCASTIAADSLDWDDFSDTMTLDATTTIAMAHALNFDSGTLFVDGQDSRVGIGTTTPDYLLTVAGDALIDEFLRVGDHTDNTRIILAGQNGNATSSALEFSENNASGNGIAFVYDSSNNYLNIEDTSADTNRWRLYRDSGNLQLLSGNLLVDGTGNSRIMGNLGIGTTSPYQELSVNGDLALTGALYDNNADAGTNGYVLQTTGSGVQWVATSSLGLNAHDAVTLAGEDYLSLSGQEITANAINPDNLANTDFGDFSCNGTNCSLDANTVATGEISDGTIIEGDLNADNAAADGDFLQYDSTGTNFVWRSGSETLGDIGAEGDLVNEAGLYAALSDVSQFWEAGDTINSGSVVSTLLTDGGTIGFDWVDAEVADALTVSGGTIGSNNISGTLTTTGSLTIGDGGDTISINSSDWDISATGVITNASLSSTQLTDGGTISFDWVDAEVDDALTISSSGSVDSTALTDGGTISFDWIDGEIADTLTIGAGSTIANNLIAPDDLLSTSQTDEYCLTYETTGDTWEWQDCSGGSSVSFGSDNQIPFTNAGGTDFDYTGNFTYDGSTLSVQTTGTADILNLLETGGTEVFTVLESGNVGIGTSTPNRKLSVVGTGQVGYFGSLNDGISIQDNSGVAELLGINSGNNAYNPIQITVGASPSMNFETDGDVGIGVTDPDKRLEVFETVADSQLKVSYDATRYGQFQVDSVGDLIIDAQGGDIRMNDENLWVCSGGSCPSGTPSGTGNLIVENRLGVGTSSPREAVEIWDDLYVAGGGATGLGQSTSTFQGDVTILGKLDVGTIDPIYTIDGTKYATYGVSSIGIKEGVTANVRLSEYNEASGYYEHRIAWSDLEQATDLWLFYQVTEFGEDWEKLVVNLTASFADAVFYEKDIATNALVIKSQSAGEVSASLTADRFDAEEWGNVRPDQHSTTTHFTVPLKP